MKRGLQAPRGHWGLHHNDPPSPLNLEQDRGSHKREAPFWIREVLSQPRPARTAFPAHPALLRSLLFLLRLSLSLLGTHLSAPRAVIAQVLLFGAAAQRQAEVRDSWHRAGDTGNFRAGGPHSRRGPNSPRRRKCGSLGRISLQGCWGEVKGDRCPLARAARPFPILGRGTRQWGFHGLQGQTNGLDGPRLRVHAPKSRLGSAYWVQVAG